MTIKSTRRTVLKGLGAASLATPALISRRSHAADGELNIMMWSDYLPESFIQGFEQETGIKINYTGIGSNEEIINKLKATKGRGFDIVSPTNARALQWKDLGLLQPFDMARVPIDRVNPAMAKIGETDWSFDGEQVYWLPHIWGTEGIAWRTDKWTPGPDGPSYGAVWVSEDSIGRPPAQGTMGRPHSMLLGAGLYLERIGELEPGSMWAAYKSEEQMRPVWEKVTQWAIERKPHVKILWDDADTQKNGLMNEGVIVGQTWDGPPLALKSAGEPVTYQAPVEGAMAWVDGMSLPTGAENLDAVYAFVEYSYRPEPAGKATDEHGYNSVVLGADQHASETYAKNFAEAYPGDALARLNPWPPEPQWYADIRTEYQNKFVNA